MLMCIVQTPRYFRNRVLLLSTTTANNILSDKTIKHSSRHRQLLLTEEMA